MIACTGQIGAGKSTVGEFFKALAVPVIDTDHLAREVVNSDSSAYQQMLNTFGPTILLANKQINRPLLRTILFNDPTAKQWLEQLLHPLIEAALDEKIQALITPYAVVLIPLFVGRPRLKAIDRLLVIDSDYIQQRVLSRDNIDCALFQKILSTQATREQLRAAADDLIINNGNLAALKQQVLQLHPYYLDLSQQ